MEITRENYEVYFIDYLEGKLDENLEGQLLLFLENNPALQKELENLPNYKIEADSINYPGKEKLYKEKFDYPDVFCQASIGILENDLSEGEKERFYNYLKKHPEKEKGFFLFQKLKISPDENIKFRSKEKLYKTSTIQIFWGYTTRIAAILILLFSFSVLLKKYSEVGVPEPQIVKISPHKVLKNTPEVLAVNDKKSSKEKTGKPTRLSPRKSTKGKTKSIDEKQGLTAHTRDSFVAPRLLGKKAILATTSPAIALSDIKHSFPDDFAAPAFQDKVLLGSRIKAKTGLDQFRLNSITKAGLNLFSNISKNKFTYSTNENGDITEINLETRLLAFSIPTNGKED